MTSRKPPLTTATLWPAFFIALNVSKTPGLKVREAEICCMAGTGKPDKRLTRSLRD